MWNFTVTALSFFSPPDHPHCFPLNKLVEVALSMEEVDCPAHNGPVPLEQLVSISALYF